MEPKYLGKRSTQPIDELDTFPAPAGLDTVTMTSDELTALCPVTGQPDFYTVTIEYVPGPLCIESKSLKLYLWHFREQGVFCEQLAVDIRDKVVATIHPSACTVTLVQKARGGIVITAVSSYTEEGKEGKSDGEA
ncbi:MAG: preQ(1) synthase [Anaerolineae bacterium]|nr:preQ(1) synthase [Anaerolineae bacterium]MCB0203163.1 preQ(1) synthase [Anaerolineae bacterium]MCB0244293.1 preQ(1) synthase [Anaerolineae bacterium]MCB0248268.1 preQ(1) synthase [Anaerolineae bacterium]MCB9129748.1 preQ(1) synthase [Anaerolineales bacterium]